MALLVFASAYSLIRIALFEVPPLTLGAIRFILASAAMLPFVMIHRRSNSNARITKSDLPLIAVLAVVQIVIPNALQNLGLEYTTASVSSVLQSTTPVFTLLFAYAALKEHIELRDLLGVMLGMTGIVLLSTGGDLSSLTGLVFVGNLLQLGVAASYAASGLIGKVLLRKYEPILVVTICFVIGAGVLSALALLEKSLWTASLSAGVVLAILLLSGLYCAALVCWYDVLQHTGVFRLYVLLFTMPVLAVAISILVLGEEFTMMDIVFSGLTLSGVALTQFRSQRG